MTGLLQKVQDGNSSTSKVRDSLADFPHDVLLAPAYRQCFLVPFQQYHPVRFAVIFMAAFEALYHIARHQTAAMDAQEMLGELLLDAVERVFQQVFTLQRA